MKLLHITTHMGGGAGKAIQTLSEYCAKNFGWEQSIVLLDTPAQTHHLERCVDSGIQIYYPGQPLDKVLLEADIIVINWWNHPLMSSFLAKLPQIKTRLLLWSHVNGCVYPFLPVEFLLRFHSIMFTTPYSFDNPAWSENERNIIKDKANVVYGTGVYDTNEFYKVDYSTNGKLFKIGYIGTLNKAKIHPDMALYCSTVKQSVPNAYFIFAGEVDETFKSDLYNAGLENCVEFCGYVSDVTGMLSKFDVFGYLLNPSHYGTTENAILEAMTYALPVILMNHGTEKFIVKNGKTGFLVTNPAEYADIVAKLAMDAALRGKIGVAARESVISKFNPDDNILRIRAVVESALNMEKESISFSDIIGDSPADWFMAFMPPQDKSAVKRALSDRIPVPPEYRRDIYKQESKSSVCQFMRYFPENIDLAYIESALGGE